MKPCISNPSELAVPTTTPGPPKLSVCIRWYAVILTGLSFAGVAVAQQQPATRFSSLQLLQEDKARNSQPPKIDKAQEWVEKAEKMFLLDPSGFFPYFDSVYQGGGLTGGGGYRKFFGDNTFWEVKGLYSILNYKLGEAGIVSKDHLNKRLKFAGKLGWRDATQVEYYGIGMGTIQDNRTNYRFQETYAEGDAELRPVKWLPIKGGFGYEYWNTMEGQGADPSIETMHTDNTAPGLGADIGYVHSKVGAAIDWRQSPGYSRKGGLYQATLHDYRNTNGGAYSFQRLDGEVIQYLPLLRETWVLAGRTRVETTLNDNDTIPYFMLPFLGSGSTLRGYSSYRFRDRHSLLMNAEFRWIPAIGWDMALFYDAGKVTSRRNDLDFKQLKSNVGIGARFHGPMATPLRMDFAIGNEGWRLVLSGGPVF